VLHTVIDTHPFLPEGVKGRLLALSVSLSLVAAIFVAVIFPVFNWYQIRETNLVFKEAEVARISAMLPLIPRMRQLIRSTRDASGEKEIFLAGETDALAGANLQASLDSLAAQANCHLSSSILEPGASVGGLRQITIGVDVTATWPQMINLLSLIDLAHPRLLVSNLNISNPGDAEAVQQDPLLQISMYVVAFRV